MSSARYEIADVIRRFGQSFEARYKPNAFQQKTLHTLSICRTAELGYHKEQCDCCAQTRIHYNSCGNRHCPKCQMAEQALWVEGLSDMVLPVKHYHVVFTVPHELNRIAMLDSRWFYNQMFAATWDTLRTFGYTRFGSESGAVMVLHTWGQNLSFHPHLHCIVPAAGVTLAGNFKHIGGGGKFLYPVIQLSTTFRGKLMGSIKRWLIKNGSWDKFKPLMDVAWKKPWNVNCEPSLGKSDHVIKYLGQYTHRVAISNQRILHISDQGVTFMHKDYRDNARLKPTTLPGVEFLRCYCQHFLPLRFVKIRYYGIYSSRFRRQTKKDNPKMVIKPKKETAAERLKRLTGFDVYQCPFCKKGTMRVIEVVPRTRSPGRINDVAQTHS
jgi:hypothetical protein